MDLKKIRSALSGKAIILLLGALGLLLLLFSSGSTQKTVEKRSPLAEAEAYRTSLEESISRLCEQIEGVGHAEVLLTLASTEIAVYAENDTASGTVIATASGDALLLSYRMPPVSGVTVVCGGGGNATVKRELTELLCATLSLPTTAVYVAPLK